MMVDKSGYRGKTAVITGAASGMGLCAAQELCASGANVVMCDVNAEALGKCAAEINAKGAGRAFACMPQMVRQGGGVICCMGSVTGFEGDGVGAMYGTAKSGLFNFVKGLAQAGAPHGVRAFCVTPGPVMTRPGMAKMKTLQGRAAETTELVNYVLFLASDDCRCVTGSNHVMDCGRLSMQPGT